MKNLPQIILIEDTREQLGYSCLFETECIREALPTGDYSIKGAEHLVSVERKEISDLIQCVTRERDRFERELARGRIIPCFHLVIEGSLTDIASGHFGRFPSKVNPIAVFETLTTFSVRYSLPIWFAEDRTIGARLTESLLTKWFREHVKTTETVTRAARRLKTA